MTECAEIPVLILCGGYGTRFKEETQFRPKPMIPIGGRPLLWHIMKSYSHFGFRRYILCLGFKGDQIKDYFLNYRAHQSDCSICLTNNSLCIHPSSVIEDWEVTLVNTGEDVMTGARLKRAAEYLGNARDFAVTYGDGLCNAHLGEEFAFHREQGRIGTVLGVHPPPRFGELETCGSQVLAFKEKPTEQEAWINGGFFFFQRCFVDEYLTNAPSCILERTPLQRLAENRELSIYKHDGFWACMDNQKDHEDLNALWERGAAPWIHPEASASCVKRLYTADEPTPLRGKR